MQFSQLIKCKFKMSNLWKLKDSIQNILDYKFKNKNKEFAFMQKYAS